MQILPPQGTIFYMYCVDEKVFRNIQMKPFECPFPFLPAPFLRCHFFSTCYKWIFSILVSLGHTKE